MTLRIIAGNRRGAHLRTLEGDRTRPLRDRVREALFSIIAAEVPGALVLDAFAGSGAVGLEAISRGARRAVLVEADREAASVVRANVAKLRFEDQTEVVQGVMPGALGRLVAEEGFTLAFLMPPYASGLCSTVLADAAMARCAGAGALAVCECHREEPPTAAPGWELEDERRYGITRLEFLRWRGVPIGLAHGGGGGVPSTQP